MSPTTKGGEELPMSGKPSFGAPRSPAIRDQPVPLCRNDAIGRPVTASSAAKMKTGRDGKDAAICPAVQFQSGNAATCTLARRVFKAGIGFFRPPHPEHLSGLRIEARRRSRVRPAAQMKTPVNHQRRLRRSARLGEGPMPEERQAHALFARDLTLEALI